MSSIGVGGVYSIAEPLSVLPTPELDGPPDSRGGEQGKLQWATECGAEWFNLHYNRNSRSRSKVLRSDPRQMGHKRSKEHIRNHHCPSDPLCTGRQIVLIECPGLLSSGVTSCVGCYLQPLGLTSSFKHAPGPLLQLYYRGNGLSVSPL